MAYVLLLVLLCLVTEYVDLLALAVLNHISFYLCGNNGVSNNKAFCGGNCQYLFEGVGFAFVNVKLFNVDNVADFVLLSSCFYYCKLWCSTSLSF